MKKLLLYCLPLVFAFSCSKNDNTGIILNPEGIAQPRSLSIFCRSSNSLLYKTDYTYADGRLTSEKTIQETPFRFTVEKYYEYNTQKQLTNVKAVTINYQQDGSVSSQGEYNTEREYQNNLLYKEYVPGSRSYYNYTYNNSTLTSKTHYGPDEKKTGTTTYSYENGLLSREFNSYENSDHTTLFTYEYDAQKRLSKVRVKENNGEVKLMEEYFYEEDKLVRKETYSWGSDPCFALCCGAYTYKYHY